MGISIRAPNIIICGTPGTGKSSLSSLLHLHDKTHDWSLIEVGKLVKEQKLYQNYDSEWDTYDVDCDKLLDYIEPLLNKGAVIIDWHACDVFDPRLIDHVFVLRTDNSILYKRLKSREYSDQKIQENIEAEIMQVCLDEAIDSYGQKKVTELKSDTEEDQDKNLRKALKILKNL